MVSFMFTQNNDYLQNSLFGVTNLLSDEKLEKLKNTEAAFFYENIFSNIDENIFLPIYCDDNGRPNAPINCIVTAIILANSNGWTHKEMFNKIDFDILTRYAMGLTDFEETPFCRATFYNFCNALSSYFAKTGENLLYQVFDNLTEKQKKELQIKTDIQRTDSFQAMSNIDRKSTRLNSSHYS